MILRSNLAMRLPSLAFSLILGGCIYVPSTIHEPVQTPQPAPVPEPEIAPAPADMAPTPPSVPVPLAAPTPVPKPEPPAPTPPTRTAVLLSDDIAAFTAIAEELRQRVSDGIVTIHDLDGDPANAGRIKAAVANADQIVAIGLLAASVGREIEGPPVVFCQVFNYQDHDLITQSSKGVNLLPPFDAQLEAWTELAPNLESIGILTGPNQDPLLDEIRTVTEASEVELAVRTVYSDKEALYAFKRLTPDVQGLWLLPDNRILGPEVVREIMAYSARHRIQVVVFGANLLRMGALMSFTSHDGDVADQVLSRFGDLSAAGELIGPDMLPLTRLEVQVNRDVARHLGLTIPEKVARSNALD